jgi:hypothetical protein
MGSARLTLAPTMVTIPPLTSIMLSTNVRRSESTVIASSTDDQDAHHGVLSSTASTIILTSCTYNINPREPRPSNPPRPYLFHPLCLIKVVHCIDH